MTETAIILAGGFGTRLKSVVTDLPKPMADIGGKPFLHYLLLYVKSFGVKQAVFCTGYLHEKVEEYFGNNFLGIGINYSREESPLGTGGAIKKAMSQIKGDCFIMNGDSFFEIDLKELFDFYKTHNAVFTFGLKQMQQFDRYGTVLLEGERIVAFREKEYTESGLINSGVYVTSSSVFDDHHLPETFSLEKDFLEVNILGMKITGMISEGYFIDIGIPDDYEKAKFEMPLMSIFK
jgi:D-glycero-alpha-D-manno-heptose 1-phosphate guanylyltransferase